jgi:hypothetical protein
MSTVGPSGSSTPLKRDRRHAAMLGIPALSGPWANQAFMDGSTWQLLRGDQIVADLIVYGCPALGPGRA